MHLSLKQDGIYKTDNKDSAGFAVTVSLKLSVHVNGNKDAKTSKPGHLALVKHFPDDMESERFGYYYRGTMLLTAAEPFHRLT